MNRYCARHGLVPMNHRCGRWQGKGSTRAWRRTRAAVLAQAGHTCTVTDCDKPATEVHHVTDTDLRAVCASHNPRGG